MGRRQMFAAINSEAAHSIALLLAQMPDALGQLVPALQGNHAVSDAFHRLDLNGDGIVGPDEIFNAKPGDSTGALGELLPAVQRDLQLGLAGENVSKLPGVSLAMLTSAAPNNNSSVNLNGNLGIVRSTTPLTNGNVVSAIELAGFCDGSVRPADGGSRQLNGGSTGFFSPLASADPKNQSWSGPITFTDPNRNMLDGVLIGLLLPAVRNSPAGFGGLVIITDGTSNTFQGASAPQRSAAYTAGSELYGGYVPPEVVCTLLRRRLTEGGEPELRVLSGIEDPSPPRAAGEKVPTGFQTNIESASRCSIGRPRISVSYSGTMARTLPSNFCHTVRMCSSCIVTRFLNEVRAIARRVSSCRSAC